MANIARISSFRLRVDVGRALLRFLARAVVISVFLAIPVYLQGGGSRVALAAPFLIGAFAAFLLLIVELVRRKLHALAVETTGPPFALVASPDRAQLLDLVRRITDAVNNPRAEFQITIEKVQVGDSITQIGDRNSIHKR